MRKIKVSTSKIGRYGRMRLEFIKHERQELYTQFLFSAGLEEYLIEINNCAKARVWELTRQITQKQGITEELKARDQMAWVKSMNTAKAQAVEMILYEMIYA